LTENDISDIQVLCAVEWAPADPTDTAMGQFDTSRAVLTLLDEEWQEVLDNGGGEPPDEVLLGGNTYNVKLLPPPLGLFDVTIQQISCEARDES